MLFGVEKLRSVAPLLLVAWAATVGAQQGSGWLVPAAERHDRDAVRRQMLDDERKAEEHAAAEAAQRREERRQASDRVGAREAEAAMDRHARNIVALKREIALTRDAGTASNTPTAAPAWDTYGNRGRTAVPAAPPD